MALSEKRRLARIFVVAHAAAWIETLCETEVFGSGDDEDYAILVEEANLLSKQLVAKSEKLKCGLEK